MALIIASEIPSTSKVKSNNIMNATGKKEVQNRKVLETIFELRRATAHELERLLPEIPYTSIIRTINTIKGEPLNWIIPTDKFINPKTGAWNTIYKVTEQGLQQLESFNF